MSGTGLDPRFEHDVLIMGGCGHVGLPLGLALAEQGVDVRLYDTNTEAVNTVNNGTMPFREGGADALLPEEAELAKLFTNTWRYIKFAIANQLFMIANEAGLDFERIRHAVTHNYPRAADMPGAGFAAGPCLFKDTMQIAAYYENQFMLGHASMMVNEGLPLYTIGRIEQRFPLATMTVGVLGMAFKGGSDDTRSSLSYKLKRLLKLKAAGVMCTDPRVTSDPDLLPLDTVLAQADLLVVAAPHPEYRDLQTSLPTVDLFNILGLGVLV